MNLFDRYAGRKTVKGEVIMELIDRVPAHRLSQMEQKTALAWTDVRDCLKADREYRNSGLAGALPGKN
jgi:hypothetical protein